MADDDTSMIGVCHSRVCWPTGSGGDHLMTIYTLYVFDRLGNCLYWHQWHQQPAAAAAALSAGQPLSTDMKAVATNAAGVKKKSAKSIEAEKKLMFGLLYSTKMFCKMIAPRKLDETEIEPFYSFTTKEYKLHYFETMTGRCHLHL